ncbi:hypothetical protein PHOSAC3_140281 [Mesotoga infera]|nr:hypothetical protein PHOSAC3_140281 [Mesotoga infera]
MAVKEHRSRLVVFVSRKRGTGSIDGITALSMAPNETSSK